MTRTVKTFSAGPDELPRTTPARRIRDAGRRSVPALRRPAPARSPDPAPTRTDARTTLRCKGFQQMGTGGGDAARPDRGRAVGFGARPGRPGRIPPRIPVGTFPAGRVGRISVAARIGCPVQSRAAVAGLPPATVRRSAPSAAVDVLYSGADAQGGQE